MWNRLEDANLIRIKGKSINFYLTRTIPTRIKPPYILLYFTNSKHQYRFVRKMIRRRRYLSDREFVLYIITPRKTINECEIHLVSLSIVLSHFDKHYVSLSLFIGYYDWMRYHKHKISINKWVKHCRDVFFNGTYIVLKKMEKEYDL